ncbi:MAG: hypothetical protein ABIQ44_13270 [Chloroflexia bacterium]
MIEEEVRAELLLLWGAYEFLLENDLSDISSTSRLLRGGDADYLRDRLAQEMLELAGVLTGEHRHNGLPQDVILEGSQVCYWLYLLALSEGLSFAQLQPDVHLVQSAGSGMNERQTAATLKAASQTVQSKQQGELLPILQWVLGLVGHCLTLFSIETAELIDHDLAQMRMRPFMDAYFARWGNG